MRHDILGVKTSNASPTFCGSLLIILFFVKICQMVIYVPSQGHITTHKYFLLKNEKSL